MESPNRGPSFGPAGDSEIETKNKPHQDGNTSSRPEAKIEELEPQISIGDNVEGQKVGNYSSNIPIGNFVSVEPNRQLYWRRVSEDLNDRASCLDSETESEAEFQDCTDDFQDGDHQNSGQCSPNQFHELSDEQGVVIRRRRPPTTTLTRNSEMEESSVSDSDSEDSDPQSQEDWLGYAPFLIFRNLTTGAVGYDRGPLKFTNVWIYDRFILKASLTVKNLTDEYLTYKAFVSCPKRVQVDSTYGLIEPRGFHVFHLNTIQGHRQISFEEFMHDKFVVYTAPVYLFSERQNQGNNWNNVKMEHLVDFWNMSLNSHWLFPRADIVNATFTCDIMPSGLGFELRSKWRSIFNWCILRIWGSEKRANGSFLFRNWERFSNFYDEVEDQKRRDKEQDISADVKNWKFKDRVRLWWGRRSFWPDLLSCCQKLIYLGFVTGVMLSFHPEFMYQETTKSNDKDFLDYKSRYFAFKLQ